LSQWQSCNPAILPFCNVTAFRVFWLTLFAIGAVVVLAAGASSGQPWTAAAFVVFFASRVVRSEIKRRRSRRRTDDAAAHANQFILATAAGWLGAGVLAVAAALAGEGVEWLFVAPLFLVMGAMNLYVALR
jgi:hypothetical protein